MNLSESKIVLLNKDKIRSRFVYHSMKRLFDIVAATCGIVILSPLMIIIAVLIKAEDHGPVFYKQVRVGKMVKHLKCINFVQCL